jgi:3-oxoacyl-[acyl-carrier protein] reductase
MKTERFTKMPKLDKRVAIITGAGYGIGRAIALELAGAGATIVIIGRNASNINEVVREIHALGRQSKAIVVDVTSSLQIIDMVRQTIDSFKRIDILVNNAAIGSRHLIVDMSEKEWDATIATNLKGTFLCIQAVARHMTEQRYGKIINVASISGIRANRPGLAAYGASKAGIIQLTKAAALELGPYGVNVNCIAPGAIATPKVLEGRTPEQVEAWQEREARQTMLGRMVTMQDIAALALFLSSDDSRSICGETIVIDGGRTCQGYFGVIGISLEEDEKFRLEKNQFTNKYLFSNK